MVGGSAWARREQRVHEIYAVSYRRLVAQLTAVSGDHGDAEEAVMEAFARALEHRGFVELINPEAWLRTVALNLARTRRRRTRRLTDLTRLVVAGERAQGPIDAAGAGVSTDRFWAERMDLLTAMRQLPTAQREAIALHHLADLSVHEVAETLQVPTGTVKARLARGRAALARLLDDTSAHSPAHSPAPASPGTPRGSSPARARPSTTDSASLPTRPARCSPSVEDPS